MAVFTEVGQIGWVNRISPPISIHSLEKEDVFWRSSRIIDNDHSSPVIQPIRKESPHWLCWKKMGEYGFRKRMQLLYDFPNCWFTASTSFSNIGRLLVCSSSPTTRVTVFDSNSDSSADFQSSFREGSIWGIGATTFVSTIIIQFYQRLPLQRKGGMPATPSCSSKSTFSRR